MGNTSGNIFLARLGCRQKLDQSCSDEGKRRRAEAIACCSFA